MDGWRKNEHAFDYRAEAVETCVLGKGSDPNRMHRAWWLRGTLAIPVAQQRQARRMTAGYVRQQTDRDGGFP